MINYGILKLGKDSFNDGNGLLNKTVYKNGNSELYYKLYRIIQDAMTSLEGLGANKVSIIYSRSNSVYSLYDEDIINEPIALKVYKHKILISYSKNDELNSLLNYIITK